jgi:hypothetical protein
MKKKLSIVSVETAGDVYFMHKADNASIFNAT